MEVLVESVCINNPFSEVARGAHIIRTVLAYCCYGCVAVSGRNPKGFLGKTTGNSNNPRLHIIWIGSLRDWITGGAKDAWASSSGGTASGGQSILAVSVPWALVTFSIHRLL